MMTSPNGMRLSKRCAAREGGVCAASAPGGSRTPNLLIRSQMLCPLSYRRRKEAV
jgi:hypothetical protein